MMTANEFLDFRRKNKVHTFSYSSLFLICSLNPNGSDFYLMVFNSSIFFLNLMLRLWRLEIYSELHFNEPCCHFIGPISLSILIFAVVIFQIRAFVDKLIEMHMAMRPPANS